MIVSELLFLNWKFFVNLFFGFRFDRFIFVEFFLVDKLSVFDVKVVFVDLMLLNVVYVFLLIKVNFSVVEVIFKFNFFFIFMVNFFFIG